MKIKHLLLPFAFLGLLGTQSPASSLILGITGDAQVGSNFINFGNIFDGPYASFPDYGTFLVTEPVTDIFAANGVTSGEHGMIQSLNAAVTPPGVPMNPDPTTAKPFMKFNTGGSNLQVFLTELLPGTNPPGSPFNLADTAAGATASFGIDGFVYNTNDKSRKQISGLFAATFAGMSVSQLLTEAAMGPITTPYAGSFSITAVPEPISLFLMGAGLMGAGLVARRKVRR